MFAAHDRDSFLSFCINSISFILAPHFVSLFILQHIVSDLLSLGYGIYFDSASDLYSLKQNYVGERMQKLGKGVGSG